jgi:MtfA peptidase
MYDLGCTFWDVRCTIYDLGFGSATIVKAEFAPYAFIVMIFLFIVISIIIPSAYARVPINGGIVIPLYRRKIKKEYLPHLVHNFPFYNALNDVQQKVFEKRVQRFIDMKLFIPRGGIQNVTAEMKVLIAGSAVQLTTGLTDIFFRHFTKILVYPDDYYSRITHKYHKGEVNLRGLIVLSWKSLKEGFIDKHDGRHLGLHEMAHALRIINFITNDEKGMYNKKVMRVFEKVAKREIERINKEGGKSFFRQSGYLNIDEFFAISVEYFFECPTELREYSNSLYIILSKMLRIDPIAVYSRTGRD